MDNFKNKKLGIFQGFSYKLFLLLSGIIFSFASLGQTTVIFSVVGTTNWTVPDDVYSITVECWGGGGGGGSAQAQTNNHRVVAGGGKGGMYSVITLSVSPSTVYGVVVGNGGTSGASGGAGGAGGKSALSLSGTDYAWASGGNGGSGSTTQANNVAAGTTYASPGDGSGTIRDGGNGRIGRYGTASGYAGGGGGGGGGTTATGGAGVTGTENGAGSVTTVSTGGAGGASLGGAGGAGARRTAVNNGSNAGTAGSDRGGAGGGSSASRTSTTQSAPGGAGGRGEVRITYTVSPLPVTLSSFNADCSGNTTYIAWTTASEQNSDYFTVERSRDGEYWSEVETVVGAGTTHSTRHYSILDDVTASYYRLIQADFDGKMTMYPVIFVDCNAKKSENGLVVYPNPSSGSVAVTINTQEDLGESTVFVHNINGQLVASHDLNVLSGTNMIQFTDIERGTYLVSVNGNGKNALKPVKLVVQ